MADKPARAKSYLVPESSNPRATNEHPALMLFDALNALHTVCSNSRSFQQLADRRKRSQALQLDFLNIKGKIASDRANELARNGGPVEQQWAALTEGIEVADDLPPSNEPAEYTKSLQEKILEPGLKWCERARTALRAGGAKGLDAATQPNAAGQSRSIELHTKLREAEGVFVGLSICVGNPSFKIDDDAASMADLGKWFARTRDELGAVFEISGLDAPARTETDSLSSDRVAKLEATIDWVAGAIESLSGQDEPEADTPLLPELMPHDKQAWQLSLMHGFTQTKVATMLNREHGTTYTQGQISRMIARAKAHAEASGLADRLPKPIDRPRTVDPAKLDLGKRVDKRKARPSDMERANDDDE